MNFYYKLFILILSIMFLCNSCEDFFLSEIDECGVIDGDNSTCADCEGIPKGSAAIDCFGDCCDGNTGLNCATEDECNECNGEFDICGVCNGNNETCMVHYSTIELILSSNCIGCHGTSGDVNLESYSNVSNFIEPGDSTSSLLWQVIQSPNPIMPPPNSGFEPLSNNHINKIALWIQLGAEEN